jgi:hypothetical protein
VHRLGFYVERIAHSQAILQHLQEQLGIEHVEVDLGPAKQLQQLCAQRIGAGGDHATRGLGSARALLRALQDLAAEFPQTALRLTPAVTTLENTLEAPRTRPGRRGPRSSTCCRPCRSRSARCRRWSTASTRCASSTSWSTGPRGTQAELLSALETLRLKLEQARTTRDRITRSAQDSLDRGHITTALFDMQRAADRFAIEPTTPGRPARRWPRTSRRPGGGARTSTTQRGATSGSPRATRRCRTTRARAARSASTRSSGAARPCSSCSRTAPTTATGPWQQDLRDVQVSLLQERADSPSSSSRARTTSTSGRASARGCSRR